MREPGHSWCGTLGGAQPDMLKEQLEYKVRRCGTCGAGDDRRQDVIILSTLP